MYYAIAIAAFVHYASQIALTYMYLKLLSYGINCSTFLTNTLTINFQIYPDPKSIPKSMLDD